MAQSMTYDENGNLVPQDAATGGFTGGMTPDQIAASGATFDPTHDAAANGGTEAAGFHGAQPQPAPAPASGAPQQQPSSLPEFGMGSLNIPPAPTFEKPSDESLVTPSNGLSSDDQSARSSMESIYGSDPGAPGGQYSGGYGRRANPLRESAIGKRLLSSSRAGTAYGNAFGNEGLTGGGKTSALTGGTSADGGQNQPSDLLLSLLQLLGG